MDIDLKIKIAPLSEAAFDLEFSPRDGINMVRYAMKRLAQTEGHPLSRDAAWHEALDQVLGAAAADLEALASRRRGSVRKRKAQVDLDELLFDEEGPAAAAAGDDQPTA